jgi:drug/metabolite transporter (DMT)-like permease
MAGHGESNSSILLMAIAAVTTALFWGIYGPLLTWGHNAMTVEVEGKQESYGRLRPFICVGVAYLIVAIVAPALLIQFGIMEPGEGLFSGWSMNGIWWSLIAGGAGAFGALFLLIALNYAPTKSGYPPPLLVMPLVFGCAPVVNAIFSMWTRNKWNLNPLFLAGMILVAVGAVTVIIGSQIPWGTPAEAKEPPPAKKPVEEKVKEEVTEEKAATENQ